MFYDVNEILKHFNDSMVDIRKSIPKEFAAFVNERETITQSDHLPEKTKWLLILVASVSQKCPICIAKAVKHCVESGWKKEEILEASMTAVLIGGSSAMTYVTLVNRALDQLSSTDLKSSHNKECVS